MKEVAKTTWLDIAVERICDSLGSAERKRLKLRSLLKLASIERRTEEAMFQLSEALFHAGVTVNPGLMKVGETWTVSADDWLVIEKAGESRVTSASSTKPSDFLPVNWSKDPWFDEVQSKNLRTEREVETKFILPLLTRLGYTEDDRYDEMPVHASHGSKQTVLRVDVALFDTSNLECSNQVLLTVEAKREERLTKTVELENAFKQARCYAMWTGCRHCLVTDGKTVILYRIGMSTLEKESELIRFEREHLKTEFPRLYSLCSKKALSNRFGKISIELEQQSSKAS